MAKPATEKPAKPVVESDSDESDDEDYAPDEKDFQSEGEAEGDSDDDDNTNETSSTGENNTSTTRSGKRRADTSSSTSAQKKLKPGNEPTPQDQAEVLLKKSRLDALWAEMNTPVSKQNLLTRRLDVSVLSGSGSDTLGTGAGWAGMSGRMVTITTTYDFAGETVTVTKDVPEDSKEARDYAAKNGKAGAGATSSSLDATSATTTIAGKDSILLTTQLLDTTTSTSSITTSSTENQDGTESPSIEVPSPGSPNITTSPSTLDSITTTKTKPPVRYIRRKSTLDQLAATYGVKKPPKLNTLEKSKLDWKNFVGKEGIEDELKHHNKDGYMEKVAFLQRTDERRDAEYQQLKKKKR